MQYAIEVNNLNKSYNKNQVVNDINLQVKKGELFALLGPNGAGKTTIIHMLSTLLKPDGGTSFIGGVDVVRNAKEVRKKISLTGQFAALDEGLSGLQNIMLIAKLHGYPNKQARSIANELIQFFDLFEARNRTLANYSGGMRRRLDIAASIVTQPDVIFLDEPTTGLDPQSRIQIWELVRTLLNLGTTVLLTTQYLEEADQLADRIAVMDKGTIIAEGTPNQLKASIGKKTLSFRLTKNYDHKMIRGILADQHALNLFQDKDPLVFRTPVTESRNANDAIHTLLKNDIPIEGFTLDEPSLDEVFLALTGSKHEEAVQ
jgi:ABC-2 type transport system ATP-binding protein